ncbi:MAG: hypothetical protein AAB356_05465, partial [Deltaproteobacteria bacterium]
MSLNCMKGGLRFFATALVVGQAAFVLTGCAPKVTGAVKEDVSITGQTGKLEGVGADYSGPSYNVAIMT